MLIACTVVFFIVWTFIPLRVIVRAGADGETLRAFFSVRVYPLPALSKSLGLKRGVSPSISPPPVRSLLRPRVLKWTKVFLALFLRLRPKVALTLLDDGDASTSARWNGVSAAVQSVYPFFNVRYFISPTVGADCAAVFSFSLLQIFLHLFAILKGRR